MREIQDEIALQDTHLRIFVRVKSGSITRADVRLQQALRLRIYIFNSWRSHHLKHSFAHSAANTVPALQFTQQQTEQQTHKKFTRLNQLLTSK